MSCAGGGAAKPPVAKRERERRMAERVVFILFAEASGCCMRGEEGAEEEGGIYARRPVSRRDSRPRLAIAQGNQRKGLREEQQSVIGTSLFMNRLVRSRDPGAVHQRL